MKFSHFIHSLRRSAALRISLAAMSVTLAAGALVETPAAAAEQLVNAAPKSFVARDATRYRENPNLAKYGLKNIIVAYSSSLWPNGADMAEPNTRYIERSYIPTIRRSKPDVVVIDIEHWKLGADLTAAELTANINKYKKVIEVFRRNLPNTKLGFYMMLPERNWLAPCGDPRKSAARTASWHERNMRLQPLADAVDIIFPSLYTLYSDDKTNACWPAYAKANIEQAKSFGKPVWAFLWAKDRALAWVKPEFWRLQLETVHQHADGLVIWSMASSRDKWSWTAPWWVETASFLKAKGLAQ